MIVDDLVKLAQAMRRRESTIDLQTKTFGRAHPGDILLLATELAAHVEVPPYGWRWWTDMVSVEAEVPRDRYTISRLSRDAGVLYQTLYAGRISADEGARCAAIIEPMRDRHFRRWCEAGEANYREAAARLETFAPDIAASLTAQADTCAAGYAPLRPLAPVADRAEAIEAPGPAPEYFEARRARARDRMLRCSVCAYLWFPRVDSPRKCPHCQRPLLAPAGLPSVPL